jgi:hypothetical protein
MFMNYDASLIIFDVVAVRRDELCCVVLIT